MGLRGPKQQRAVTVVPHFKPAAWKRKRSRVARIVAFLESLPITKGILAGGKMRLLAGQHQLIKLEK